MLFLHLSSQNVAYSKGLSCNFIAMHEISGKRKLLRNCSYKIYQFHQNYHPKQIFMEIGTFNSLLHKVSGELPM